MSLDRETIAIDALAFDGIGTQSGMIDPVSTPSAWDYIVLAGCISPGIAEVSGAETTYKWDEPKAKGSSGSDITYQGREPAKVSVKLKLWAPSHFHTWELFRQLLVVPDDSATPSGGAVTSEGNDLGPRFDAYPSSGTTTSADATRSREPVALDIEHPWCAMAGIHAVVPDKVGQPEPDGAGAWTVEIVLRQYEKPKAAGGKPAGTVANAGVPGAVPTPPSKGDPWATVPNPDGNDYRKAEERTAEGRAVDGEGRAIGEEPV